jgi:putative membrane protein
MARLTLTPADHARISAAVHEAELRSDGEIVTIVARQSDAYHDVGLHWAIAASVLVLAAAATVPAFAERLFIALLGGWMHALPLRLFLTMLLGAMILTFLAVRYLLALRLLRMAMTPRATRARRVRRRAVALFRATVESRTRARTGVLIYLSLAEHQAELVADAAINDRVDPGAWGAAMAALIDGVREGRVADGMVAAVTQVGALLAAHFPRRTDDTNELPDRLIEL